MRDDVVNPRERLRYYVLLESHAATAVPLTLTNRPETPFILLQ